jgi:hypothetical protein
MRKGNRLGTWRPLLAALVALPLCAAALPGAAAAVSFNISPSTITNDYLGAITFTVTGITPGQTVVVEKYADLNGNGSVDADEPLMDRFTVTDGHVPLIAGVRNLNLPGDDDGAENGDITATAFYTAEEIGRAHV